MMNLSKEKSFNFLNYKYSNFVISELIGEIYL